MKSVYEPGVGVTEYPTGINMRIEWGIQLVSTGTVFTRFFNPTRRHIKSKEDAEAAAREAEFNMPGNHKKYIPVFRMVSQWQEP